MHGMRQAAGPRSQGLVGRAPLLEEILDILVLCTLLRTLLRTLLCTLLRTLRLRTLHVLRSAA
jgi:hypothetical protein